MDKNQIKSIRHLSIRHVQTMQKILKLKILMNSKKNPNMMKPSRKIKRYRELNNNNASIMKIKKEIAKINHQKASLYHNAKSKDVKSLKSKKKILNKVGKAKAMNMRMMMKCYPNKQMLNNSILKSRAVKILYNVSSKEMIKLNPKQGIKKLKKIIK